MIDKATLQKGVQQWKNDHLPSEEVLEKRKKEALEQVADKKADWKKLVYERLGLIVPDHLFTFWAMWLRLTKAEQKILRWGVGSGISPSGFMNWFTENDTSLQLKERFDHRLYYRFFCDPPAFFSCLHGHTDGWHYGLWVDKPNEAPTTFGAYYNNDGGDISGFTGTTLELILDEIETIEAIGNFYDKEDELERKVEFEVIRSVIAAFSPYDHPIPTHLKNRKRQDWTGTAGFYVPQAAKFQINRTQYVGYSGQYNIWTEYDKDKPIVEKWYRAAKQGLKKGCPYVAFQIGHELFRYSGTKQNYRTQANELLTKAYQLLGYDNLAEIADLHYHFRDLGNVASMYKTKN